MMFIVPYLRQAAIENYLKQIGELDQKINKERFDVNLDIAHMKDLVEYNQIEELKNMIMNMPYKY